MENQETGKNEQLKPLAVDDGYAADSNLDIGKMKRKEFDLLPQRDWDRNIGEFDSLVILPLRQKHDSGYRLLDFVACLKNHPICRLSGCSDVIHFNGIGGFGYNWLEKYGKCPESTKPTAWNIDCLPTSGLLRIFTNSGKLIAGTALSGFEIYSI